MSRLKRAFVCAGLLAVSLQAVSAAAPTVRFITATDVTPRSFRLVWLSSDPASASLRLFEAPGCTHEIVNADVQAFPTVSGNPAIVSMAQQKGVLTALVRGLEPDTDYCVRTVTTSLFSSLQTIAPDPGLIVRTERLTTRSKAVSPGDPNQMAFSNDLARFEITRSIPGSDTRGALLLVKVKGAASPLSGFVGDGLDDDSDPTTHTTLAMIDLNNLYDAASHESLDLSGDGTEEIHAWVLGGPEGFITAHGRIVAADLGLNALVGPAPCLGAGATACDGRLGDADGDGLITGADAEAVRDFVLSLSPAPACAVCADVTWEFNEDMKDALALIQIVTGLRLLP